MRYISLFLFVVVIGISSVAEAPHYTSHHPGEMEPSVDILLDEFRGSIRASFERAAQDIGESLGHMVEEHINEAVNAAVEEARREAEQQRMELEQQYEAAAAKDQRQPIVDVDVNRDNFGSVGPLEDIDAQWQKLGCDSEQSCMELLAKYVEGGEGHVGLDIGPVFDEDPSSGPVTPREGTAVGGRGFVTGNGQWLAKLEAQLHSLDSSQWSHFTQLVGQYVEDSGRVGMESRGLARDAHGRDTFVEEAGHHISVDERLDGHFRTSEGLRIHLDIVEGNINKIAALEAQLQAANEEITSLQIEDGIDIDNDYNE